MSDETTAPPVIETRAIVKSFAGVRALRGVDLDGACRRDPCAARPERCRQVDAGQDPERRPSAGSYDGDVIVAGEPAACLDLDARARGHRLCAAGNRGSGKRSPSPRTSSPARPGSAAVWLVGQRRLEARTRALFAEMGLAIDPHALVASLTSAQRHLVMIARALSFDPACSCSTSRRPRFPASRSSGFSRCCAG